MDSVFQFFSFFFSFGSGIIPEYLRKNLKSEKLFFQRDPGRDSPYGFSFSAFQFWFGNYSGIFAEKLKNFFPERSRKIFSIWIQFFSLGSGTIPEYFQNIEKLKNCFFQGHSGRDSLYGFSFSVFQFYCIIGQEQLYNCFLRVSSVHVIYLLIILYISFIYGAPQKKLPKSRGQNVRETL